MEPLTTKYFINALFHRINYYEFWAISQLMKIKPHFIGSPREATYQAEAKVILARKECIQQEVKKYIATLIKRPEIAQELTEEEKEGILAALHGKPSEWTRPCALFMCGIQGSGRTSDLPEEAMMGAIIIDADAIVPTLTLTDDTEEERYQVYRQAMTIAEEQALQACAGRRKFIFETTLAFEFSKLDKMIQTILAMDGDVMIRYLDVSAETSYVRLQAWEQINDTTSFVTIQEVVDAYNHSLPAYLELLKRYKGENRVSFMYAKNDVDLEDPKEVDEKLIDPISKKQAKDVRTTGQGFDYWDDWKEHPITCPVCDWAGPLKNACGEPYRELTEYTCPKCFTILAIVRYPTEQETREAAGKGIKAAQQELWSLEKSKEYFKAFNEVKLKSIDQLPEITAEKINFVWDNVFVENGVGETHIKVGDITIWHEPVIFEGWRRFNQIKQLLKDKYGAKFVELRPTELSRTYLFGDDFSALDKVTFT